MRIFLTGGHGFIGSRVTRLLVARGDDVTLLLRPKSDTSRVKEQRWTRADGDLLDLGSLERGMKGHDAVIHLACISSWAQMGSGELERVILEGTKNVLEAAKRNGIKRVVFVSSAAAVAASDGPTVFDEASAFNLEHSGLRYAVAKKKAEDEAIAFARAANLELVIVNPAEVYGPEDDQFVTAGNLRDVLTSWAALGCDGGTSVVHVEDVAHGILLALEKGRACERYILGGDNLSIAELIRHTLSAAGQNKPVLILPTWLIKGLIKTLAALRLPTPLDPQVVEYATRYWFMSSDKAKKELGYTARPGNVAIASAVKWLAEKGHVPSRRALAPSNPG